jgi:hypothetical protein
LEVGSGARLALDFEETAEDAKSDGLPMMLPYLTQTEQEGVY